MPRFVVSAPSTTGSLRRHNRYWRGREARFRFPFETNRSGFIATPHEGHISRDEMGRGVARGLADQLRDNR